MADLKNAKMFGGIGTILMLIGSFIPLVGFILPLIGLILVVLAVHTIGNLTKDDSIFKNYLLSFVLQIVAVVAFVGILIVTIGATVGFDFMGLIQTLQTEAGMSDPTAVFGDIGAMLGGCCLAFVVLWVLMLISSLFLKKSFKSISDHTNVSLFATTGLVYLIGAGLIIIGIGAFVLFIALILQIIAFFSLPDSLSGSGIGGIADDAERRCPNCGRAIPMDARACPYCAKKFEE